MPIPTKDFDERSIEVAKEFNICISDFIDGEEVFAKYIDILSFKDEDFCKRTTNTKKLYGLMTKFMFSVYDKAAKELMNFACKDYTEKYEMIYLMNWKDFEGRQVYSYEGGIDAKRIENDNFF